MFKVLFHSLLGSFKLSLPVLYTITIELYSALAFCQNIAFIIVLFSLIYGLDPHAHLEVQFVSVNIFTRACVETGTNINWINTACPYGADNRPISVRS